MSWSRVILVEGKTAVEFSKRGGQKKQHRRFIKGVESIVENQHSLFFYDMTRYIEHI